MKAKIATVTFIALLACSSARAQTTPAGDQSAGSAAAPAASAAAPVAPAAAPAAAADAPAAAPAAAADAPAAAPAAAADAPAAPAAAADAPAAPAAAADAPAAPAAAEATAVPAAPAVGAVSPIIQFQDVELTKAIENLARMAGLNYILDPKVPFGQPGPDGKVMSQPNISLRWENITAEQALAALLTTYSLQIVEDPKLKVSRITVRDPAAPDPLVTHVIQLKYASASNLVNAVQSTLTDKRSKVVADARTSQLVVLATEKEQLGVEELISKLDGPTKQVLIAARLMEISRNPSTVKGIDWSPTLKEQNITFGNGTTIGQTTTTIPGVPGTTPSGEPTSPRSTEQTVLTTLSGAGIGGLSLNTFNGFSPNIGFLNADGVKAILSFLNEDADTQVISTPRIVTLDNEPAMLMVTRAVPIFKNTAGTQGSPGGSEVQYTNLGTILHVTPRVSANDMVWMRVVPEVSSIFKTDTKIVAGTVNQADEYDIRKIETQVIIPSGNTLVMGGLLADGTKNIYNKVPVLGDLPLIGLAFRHENKARDKKNLLIFVTPTIVKDNDFQPSQTDFLKSKPGQIEGGIDTSKAWESAKPRDWSNPEATPYDEAVFNDKGVEPTTPAKPTTTP